MQNTLMGYGIWLLLEKRGPGFDCDIAQGSGKCKISERDAGFDR